MRLRFSLRALWIVVTLACVYMSLVALAGLLEGSLLAIGLATLMASWWFKGVDARNRLAVAGLSLALLWVVAVDASSFRGACPRCYHFRATAQIRVLQLVVFEETYNDSTALELIARDLGTPCTHQGLSMWQKHRWWGLIYCYRPCFNGTERLVSGTWYGPDEEAVLKTMAREHPELADEFYHRALEQHDSQFIQAFYRTLDDEVCRIQSEQQ